MSKTSIEIFATVVPSSLQDVADARTRYPFVQGIQIDAADGRFAPNTTWMPAPDEKLPDAEVFFYETHLMVENPLPSGLAFVHAGAKRVIGHVESFSNAESAREAIEMWRKAGAKEVGIAALLETPLESLEPYLGICDFVLFMSIATIGKQGIPFDERGIERVRAFHKKHNEIPIGVDGGVSETNIKQFVKAGATRFSVGSVIAKSDNPEGAYRKLLALAG